MSHIKYEGGGKRSGIVIIRLIINIGVEIESFANSEIQDHFSFVVSVLSLYYYLT